MTDRERLIKEHNRTLPLRWFDLITTQEELWYRNPELRPADWDAEAWAKRHSVKTYSGSNSRSE